MNKKFLMAEFTAVLILLLACGCQKKDIPEASEEYLNIVIEDNDFYIVGAQESEEFETETELIIKTYFEEYVDTYYQNEIIMLAKLVYGEARGIKSQTEQACIIWTVLNRVDKYNHSIKKIITQPNQFAYRSKAHTFDDYGRDLKELARDVLIRWEREKAGEQSVGRVLPKDYLWYAGRKGHNWFRKVYRGQNIKYWNYKWDSPYES